MNIPQLTSLTALTTLNFSFRDGVITEKSAKHLFEGLEELKFLSNLSLSIENNQSRNTFFIEGLTLNLPKLNSLSSLKLELGEITDQEAQFLSLGVRKLKSLTTFSFASRYSRNSHIDGIRSLVLALQEIKLLSELKIGLGICRQFSDAEVQLLTEVLAELKFLTRLYVSIYWCAIISEKEVMLLLKEIKRHENLLSVNLSFIEDPEYATRWEEADTERMAELSKELNWRPDFYLYSPYVRFH